MKIHTKYGEMDEERLEKRLPAPGVVEYYRDGELVHRSATTQLTGVAATAIAKRLV